MKTRISLILSIFLLISFSCQSEIKKKVKDVPKKQPKNIQIIKRNIPVLPVESVKNAVKNDQNFIKLVKSFQPETFSKDELIDLIQRDLKYFKLIHARKFKSKIDTAAVKSRLVLTEINLKRLHFLLQKPKVPSDTIEKTLNTVVQNLNEVIQKIAVYDKSVDEFESILKLDSITRQKQDSIQILEEK